MPSAAWTGLSSRAAIRPYLAWSIGLFALILLSGCAAQREFETRIRDAQLQAECRRTSGTPLPILTYFPLDGATQVSRNTVVFVEFDDSKLDLTSLDKAFWVTDSADSSLVIGTALVGNRFMAFPEFAEGFYAPDAYHENPTALVNRLMDVEAAKLGDVVLDGSYSAETTITAQLSIGCYTPFTFSFQTTQ